MEWIDIILNSMSQITDPIVWGVIFGAIAIGYLIYLALNKWTPNPKVTSAFISAEVKVLDEIKEHSTKPVPSEIPQKIIDRNNQYQDTTKDVIATAHREPESKVEISEDEKEEEIDNAFRLVPQSGLKIPMPKCKPPRIRVNPESGVVYVHPIPSQSDFENNVKEAVNEVVETTQEVPVSITKSETETSAVPTNNVGPAKKRGRPAKAVTPNEQAIKDAIVAEVK